MWDTTKYQYWDIGEVNIITLSDASMARVLRALILCEGKVHSTYCMEKKMFSAELNYKPRYCHVIMRISLPTGAASEFQKLSKCTLSEPPKVTVSKGDS